MKLSIIIPALNEADNIVATLRPLQALRAKGHQLILVDGSSGDRTVAVAEPLVDLCLRSPAGRAKQMNNGAAKAAHPVLLFLHADTLLPKDAADQINAAVLRKHWGRFDLRIDGDHPFFPIVSFFINLRSRFTGIATGDQAIFVRTALFNRLGGFPELPLMEDIALSRRLRKIERPACLRGKVLTSGRRWRRHGAVRTILLMWILRLAYFVGVKPQRLARYYARH